MCFKLHVGYVHILDFDFCNLNVWPINLYAHVILKNIIIILSLHASITFFCSPITYVSHLSSLLKSSSFWVVNYSHVHCIYLICLGPIVLDHVTIRSCQGFEAQVFFSQSCPFYTSYMWCYFWPKH